ncbi:MAG: nuclease [Cellvibrio sp. 79]|nr:MAG: nuclease [Cellvibrio sp. 79]
MQQSRKTPVRLLTGVFLCLLSSSFVLAECGHPESTAIKVAKVQDGDTLKLSDGRSVRVLGINAPEITIGQKRGQPLGQESLASARQFVARAGGEVRLGFDAEKRDHYGRWLAHVYDKSGRSLAAEQIRAGMALQVSVPPNGAQESCLYSIESRARKKPSGVWSNSYWSSFPSTSLTVGDTGFRLVRGKVMRVDVNSSVWIEFDGDLVAQIKKSDWRTFGRNDWQSLQGKTVEVRGWITARKDKGSQNGKRRFKSLVMGVRTPSSLKVID